MTQTKRLIIGITGASGALYGERTLMLLRDLDVETHLVVTKAAAMTYSYECGKSISDLTALADVVYPLGDVGAAIASGSYRTIGMLIAPCSIKSMSEIAAGITSNLLTRAADVVLKERRRLVLMVRETPFHLGHLRAMTQITEMGGVIAPPLPAFYANPASIEEMVDQSVGRALDLFEIDAPTVKRWREAEQKDDR